MFVRKDVHRLGDLEASPKEGSVVTLAIDVPAVLRFAPAVIYAAVSGPPCFTVSQFAELRDLS
jgi:hypothetical protein